MLAFKLNIVAGLAYVKKDASLDTMGTVSRDRWYASGHIGITRSQVGVATQKPAGSS